MSLFQKKPKGFKYYAISTLEITLGLLVMPVFFIFAPREVIKMLRNPSKGEAGYNPNYDPNFEDNIADLIKVDATDETDDTIFLKEIQRIIDTLIQKNDWLLLARQMEEWDQKRTASPSGLRLSEFAMQSLLQQISIRTIPGNPCHPEDIFDIPEDVADHFEDLSSRHPKQYALATIGARIRIHQGWLRRGSGYVQYMSEDGWTEMEWLAFRAKWLMGDRDPVALNAPLLAAARFKLLAFMPDADKHLTRYYEEWSELDPGDQAPHRAYAWMLLPQWFGRLDVLEAEANRAALRTQATSGDAAYASMMLHVQCEAPHVVLFADLDLLRRAICDLIDQNKAADPGQVARIVCELQWWGTSPFFQVENPDHKKRMKKVQHHVKSMCDTLIRTRLTAIYLPAWDEGSEDVLDAIYSAFEKELQQGATVRFGPSGLEAALPDDTTQN